MYQRVCEREEAAAAVHAKSWGDIYIIHTLTHTLTLTHTHTHTCKHAEKQRRQKYTPGVEPETALEAWEMFKAKDLQGTQFTCFTGTKVQILTTEARQGF